MFNELFNNKEWVRTNLRGFNPNNCDQVFEHVVRVHPHYGCATTEYTKWNSFLQTNRRTISMDDAARFADAVVCFCFEAMGNDNAHAESLKEGIASGIGSIIAFMSIPAFIALNHSNPAVRAEFARIFELARKIGDLGG